jgi:hypothetical protein
MTRLEIDTHRQVFAGESQRVTKLLLAQLSAGLAELLFDLLLDLGIEVGYLKHPANFDHFVILSGDARGLFERLFARLHLDDPVAADHFLRFGKRTVGNFRFSAFEGDARAHRRGRGQPSSASSRLPFHNQVMEARWLESTYRVRPLLRVGRL